LAGVSEAQREEQRVSGHSKWSTIKHKKGAADAKRGKLFARLIRGIEAAAKDGGADPDANSTLATAIQKARDNSVPKDNIERALKRAAGREGGGVQYDTVYYEGYGPGGVAVYVECLTDNRNRAANDVRAAFNKNGGSLAEPGAVNYLFTRTGVVMVPAAASEDDILVAGLDAGITDVVREGDTFRVTSEPADVNDVRQALLDAGVPVDASESTMLPSVSVPVADESSARQVLRLIEALEDCDDVQNVYANFDISDEVLESVA
jgi:YebC/PmpR family DNA-binding regulatory protein